MPLKSLVPSAMGRPFDVMRSRGATGPDHAKQEAINDSDHARNTSAATPNFLDRAATCRAFRCRLPASTSLTTP
jgi:hypothetical protein